MIPAVRVLVVDDDAATRDVLREALAIEGWAVDGARHGAEAIEILARGLPDVVLVDMRMPVMDGWSLVRAIRQRYGATLPIIVTTAVHGVDSIERELAVNAVVQKPFDLDRIIALVRHHAAAGSTSDRNL